MLPKSGILILYEYCIYDVWTLTYSCVCYTTSTDYLLLLSNALFSFYFGHIISCQLGGTFLMHTFVLLEIPSKRAERMSQKLISPYQEYI